VDDNGEDDIGIRRHQATTNPVMVTMATMVAVVVAAMVDNDDDDKTTSLNVVGPDNDGGDGSWWGV
jgi:NAD(P)H-hydrate repair Nnr-like enzyme with NAD(P)H-hydrate epimerase domain